MRLALINEEYAGNKKPLSKKKGVFHAELNHNYKIFPIISLYIIFTSLK